MPNLSCMSVVYLFAIAGAVSGCSGLWSWPDIRMVQNTDDLGTSPIGNYLRDESTDHTEAGLKARIAEFIMAQVSAQGLSRKQAEALGMQCAQAPSTECTYSGSRWYRIERLP